MPKPFDFGDIHLSVDGETLPTPEPDTPFRIAVLGDFSGRGFFGGSPGQRQRPLLVDRDNFDEVLAEVAPVLELPCGDSVLRLQFKYLDDFHPDRLFQNTEIFRRLREARTLLRDHVAFSESPAALGAHGNKEAIKKPPHLSAPNAAADVVASGSLLDAMANDADAVTAAQPARTRDPIREFLDQVTATHLVAKADPRQAEHLAAIDLAISAQMKALLHVPFFQALESAWRSLFFLVRRIETGPQLKLYLVDMSRPDLSRDLMQGDDLRHTHLYRLLTGTPEFDPWSLVVGDYEFAAEVSQVEVLGRIAKICSAADVPFVASARTSPASGLPFLTEVPGLSEPQQAPSPDARDAWAALRRQPEAAYIGLVLPRFLLRMPYGKNTDSIESFDFEEFAEDSVHDDYLWGNPAFACAALLAASFSEDGWHMTPGSQSEIDGLPLHTYQSAGDWLVKPCAENLMTENTALQILESGIMPLVGLKGTDTVKLLRFQSIAQPLQPLAGPWNR